MNLKIVLYIAIALLSFGGGGAFALKAFRTPQGMNGLLRGFYFFYYGLLAAGLSIWPVAAGSTIFFFDSPPRDGGAALALYTLAASICLYPLWCILACRFTRRMVIQNKPIIIQIACSLLPLGIAAGNLMLLYLFDSRFLLGH